jgi:hypothetical protein
MAPEEVVAEASPSGPPSPGPHERMQELLAGYMAGAFTSSMISLGDKYDSVTHPSRGNCAMHDSFFLDNVPYSGCRLGLYKALKEIGPGSADELAKRTGLNVRYIAEWLRQQVVQVQGACTCLHGLACKHIAFSSDGKSFPVSIQCL